MKKVKGPDGVEHGFPEDAPDEAINAEMAKLYAAPPQASSTATPAQPAVPALRGTQESPEPVPATPAAADPLAPPGTPQTAPRDYTSMYALAPGMRITDKGIEAERVKPEHLTAQQREALDKLPDWDPTQPSGSAKNPMVARGAPHGPVGAYVMKEDGTLVQSKPRYDDRLGFDQEVTRATNNMFSLIGRDGGQRDAREREMKRARLAGVEPGMVGSLPGSVIGTFPYVFATRNPYVGGAIAGAANTKGDTVEEVGRDAALGAASGRLFDMAGNFIGDTIAPPVKEAVNRLMKLGVKLTPGQMAGGAAKKIEEAATSIPIAGDMISGSQREAMESFNTAAINEAIDPAGLKLGKTGPDELIERRAPPKPGKMEQVKQEATQGTATPTQRRLEDQPLAVGENQLAIGENRLALPGPGGQPTAAPNRASAFDKTALDGPAAVNSAGQRALPGPKDEVSLPTKIDDRTVGGTVARILEKVGITTPAAKIRGKFTDAATGQPVNKGTNSPAQFGHEAVEWAHQQLRVKYNNLLQGTSSNLKNLDPQAMTEISEAAKALTPDNLSAFQRFVETNVKPRFFRGDKGDFGGVIRGDEWKELDSMIGNEIREFGRSLDPNQRKLGQVYRQLQTELREMFAKGVEQGRKAAPLPTMRNPGNQAVDAVNETVIAKHAKDVKDWEKMFEGVPMEKRPPMPKLDADKMQKALPDLDAGFTRGAGGEAVEGSVTFANELRGIDKAFSNLLRIEQAASRAAGGIFTPQGLKQAVREMDSSLRRRASAHGQAPMQDLAEAGMQVLNRQVPDSGTATRGLINTAAGAALLGVLPNANPNPMLLATLGAMLSPYTRAGGGIARTIMARRPAGANRLRAVTDAITGEIDRPGAGAVVALRGRHSDDEDKYVKD